MPTYATKTAIAEAPPNIKGHWTLWVHSGSSELDALNELVVSAETSGLTENQIIGSVSGPEIVFLMRDAHINDKGEVEFVLIVNNEGFHFSGTVTPDGKHINGGINPPSGSDFDDGSWSAQATGGGPPDGDGS
jgi:hypothetical protein